MKWYKVHATYINEYEHCCDCEHCTIAGIQQDDEWHDVSTMAQDEASAKQHAAAAVRDRRDGAKDIKTTIVHVESIPHGRFLLDSTYVVYELDNGMLSDGFVALYKKHCISYAEIVRQAAWPYEITPTHDLTDYTTGELGKTEAANFREASFNLDWVTRLYEIGIHIHAVEGGSETQPFALCKKGELVGLIMPMLR